MTAGTSTPDGRMMSYDDLVAAGYYDRNDGTFTPLARGTDAPCDPMASTHLGATPGTKAKKSTPRLAELLDDLHERLGRYVAFPTSEAHDAVTLWIAATHAQPAWAHATRLVIRSPEKRCGKSRLLDTIEATCWRPLVTVNATVSAVFRSIDDEDPPTLLIDEADTIFGRKSAEGTEELRGLLNAGFGRGRPAIRCVGPSQTPTEFSTFAMAALAAIGEVIPDTITDRAVTITMRRRGPGEHVQSYRRRRDALPMQELGQALHGEIRQHLDVLEHAEPSMPVEDRAADTWEPLVAVADLAGGSWPERARAAAKKMSREADQSAADESLKQQLLTDLRTIVEGLGEPRDVSSAELIAALHNLDHSPWAKFELTQSDLARKLRPYGAKPVQVRPDGGSTSQVRGYRYADLTDAFARYLPAPKKDDDDKAAPPASQGVTPSHPLVAPVTPPEDVTPLPVTRQGGVTALTSTCDGVTGCDTSPDGFEYDPEEVF